MTDAGEGRPVTEADLAGLRAIASCVVPGEGAYPPAGDLDVAERMLERFTGQPEDRRAVSGVLASLDQGTPTRAALEHLETEDRRDLQRVLQCVYSAYYEHPAVRRVLTERHGYPDRPPQPLGYDPEAGDLQLARLEGRRIATLETTDWWLDRFEGLDA